jgi:RNA polymerase sigma-B factor
VSAVREISRRETRPAQTAHPRRAGEVRLARYHQTCDAHERAALVERFMPLARSLAARYRHTSEPFDDLLQVASIGLLKAIDRYDPARGYAFSSFAVPTILGELRRHLRDHTWSVHVPRDLQELGQRLTPVADELSGELGRAPTIAELAERLGVSEEEVLDAREATAAHSPASLDERVSTEDQAVTLGELLGGEDEALDNAEDAILLEHYLGHLSPRDQMVLRLRFQKDLKQREIGATLGISQMHVSRLIRQSLEQLQAIATAEADSDRHPGTPGPKEDHRHAATPPPGPPPVHENHRR